MARQNEYKDFEINNKIQFYLKCILKFDEKREAHCL